MTIWDEAFEALADPGSGLSEPGQYFASPSAEARSLSGPFDERPQQDQTVEDQLGRGDRKRAVWQVPKSDSNGSITIATDGNAWCVVRGLKWKILGVGEDKASWIVELETMTDQKIRKVQRSTRP